MCKSAFSNTCDPAAWPARENPSPLALASRAIPNPIFLDSASQFPRQLGDLPVSGSDVNTNRRAFRIISGRYGKLNNRGRFISSIRLLLKSNSLVFIYTITPIPWVRLFLIVCSSLVVSNFINLFVISRYSSSDYHIISIYQPKMFEPSFWIKIHQFSIIQSLTLLNSLVIFGVLVKPSSSLSCDSIHYHCRRYRT